MKADDWAKVAVQQQLTHGVKWLVYSAGRGARMASAQIPRTAEAGDRAKEARWTPGVQEEV